MTTIAISSSQKALVEALIKSKDFAHEKTRWLCAAILAFHRSVGPDTTFRQLRRTADQLGLKWE